MTHRREIRTRSAVIDRAQQLAAAGRHADVVQLLGTRTRSELEGLPSLALLYGTAHAQLGRNAEAVRWLDLAVDRAREHQEPAVERHALNARGAAALVGGRLDEAADFFTRALMVASRDGDLATTGRCSNNLGIISNLRGRHAEAIGSWQIAVVAFDRVGLHRGVAECRHNLAIAYRQQGNTGAALAEADQAVAQAEASGDRLLWAQALRGRAEIRLVRGEKDLARQELDEVRATREHVSNPVGEIEDLRVESALLAADGDVAAAERAIREVISRAEPYGRPHLLGEAWRDLASLLRRSGREVEAQGAARTARAIFAGLGAEGEIRHLAAQGWDEKFGAELRGSLTALHAAQSLADQGRYAELIAYLATRTQDELEHSPMLTLLCGIAHGRLGRLELGQQWAMVARLRARALGDRALEVRALNVCGAIALERGGIGEASYFFTRAQEEAMERADMGSVGRSANNLGIIANMQGDQARAIGAYTRAIAAYQKAGDHRGVVESSHNLGISYREQGMLSEALAAADEAARQADALGDRRLRAQALAGRAEIRVAMGDAQLAIREAEGALAVHGELRDSVLEAEDLRILASALSAAGRTNDAMVMLHDVIRRATEHRRPLLVAVAQRDLARLLSGKGNDAEAKHFARAARAAFAQVGANAEMAKLDSFLGEVEAEVGDGVEPSGSGSTR
jgi:tetratricopeptide (TPR) repeat protein